MKYVTKNIIPNSATQQELFERNAIFNILLANSNLSMWTYDIKTHMATLISSKKHKRPMSYKGTPDYPESIIALGFIHPRSIFTIRNLLHQVADGVPTVSGDIWYQPTNDEPWCDCVTYINVFAEDGSILKTVGIAEDVTAQRIAQQQYEEELAYQNSLNDQNLLAKVCCNITQNKVESYKALKIAKAHASANISYDKAISELALTAYSNEDRLLIQKNLDAKYIISEFTRGQLLHSFNYRRILNDNRIIWVNIYIKLFKEMLHSDIKAFIYTTNIDRKKTTENIVQTVATVEHDYIMLVNILKSEYSLYSGQGGKDYLPPSHGSDFCAMIKTYNTQLIDVKDVERSIHDLQPSVIIENLKKEKKFSSMYKLKDKDNKPCYKRIQYFWLDEGQSLLIITRSDVTSAMQKQIIQQELLISALKHAEQANNAKTNFLSKMSHEIRTPMNGIIGLNALALENINNFDLVKDCLNKTSISANYLLALINDILDMSRIESGKVNVRQEEFSLQALLEEINIVIYEQACSKKLDYDVILQGDINDTFIGDMMKIKQIIINLLGNAIKFTPAGGKVNLSVSQLYRPGNITFLKFVVKDTGIGISEKFQKVMFQPFEQGENSSSSAYIGTGLGLTICKNLVEIMGGSIGVHSTVNVGTEFYIKIPLQICKSKIQKKQADFASLQNIDTLVVDDDKIICSETTRLLESMGVPADWATSGAEAIKKVKNRMLQASPYDAILIDWKMPNMDGIETTKRIRKIVGPSVTIIIITAYEWAEIEHEAKKAGVNILVTKPLSKTLLMTTLLKVASPSLLQHENINQAQYNFTGKRVLLVEDQPLNAEIAKKLLESKGIQITVADNGLAAVDAFSSAPANYFDVILMDIRMPKMDGLQATKIIRSNTKAGSKSIPIIALSANAFEEDIEKALAAGMNYYLTKPINPKTLYSVLQKCFEYEYTTKQNIKTKN